jgi:hypothetical protein
MKTEIYKRPYRMRRTALAGKEVTVPPTVPIEPGQMVVVLGMLGITVWIDGENADITGTIDPGVELTPSLMEK